MSVIKGIWECTRVKINERAKLNSVLNMLAIHQLDWRVSYLYYDGVQVPFVLWHKYYLKIHYLSSPDKCSGPCQWFGVLNKSVPGRTASANDLVTRYCLAEIMGSIVVCSRYITMRCTYKSNWMMYMCICDYGKVNQYLNMWPIHI